ncbi:glycosyltransferase [Candidatus Solincola sp.]|nr:glycosyltransferase [Actinomycetota bacterium]MDI7251750.1 glycosyltransferase [Actinomycetota bacterium]
MPEAGPPVSLVATVLDEADTLSQWWRSILSQTQPPDEVVVVDGGSRDGTAEALRRLAGEAPFPTRVEVLPGSNIARGRNLAVSLARHDIVAVTDAGCVLDPAWLENLVAPFREDPDVELVAGFYQPLEGSWFQALSACVTLPLPHQVRGERFMPSSRSLAFRREVWERAGGYPEWLDIGEDMYFNHRWRELGIRHVFRPEAVVYWRMRPDLPSLLRQYFLYARGDGESGMYPHRHLIRFAVYGALLGAACVRRTRRLLPLAALPACLYAGRRWRRIPVFLWGRTLTEKAAAAAAVPFLLAGVDVAKMAGYLNGRWRRWMRQKGEAGG